MEMRKDKRHTTDVKIRIRYTLDDIKLCDHAQCDKGKVITDRVTEDGKFELDDCPVCDGKGFYLH